MKRLLILICCCFVFCLLKSVYGDEGEEKCQDISKSPQKVKKPSIVCTGDKVIYHREKKMTEGVGNVYIAYDDSKLFSDRGEFYVKDQKATASGNVIMFREDEIFSGDQIKYNFKTKKGEVTNANSFTSPWYGWGEKVDRKSESEILINLGYVTTCDYETPHYKFKSKRIKVSPGDKLTAFNNIFLVGKVPLFWLPYYVYSIDGERSKFSMIPGYNSRFGTFILTETALDDWKKHNVYGTIHTDYYTKRGWGVGLDGDYNNSTDLKSSFRAYYIRDEDYIPFRGNENIKDRYRISFQGDYLFKKRIQDGQTIENDSLLKNKVQDGQALNDNSLATKEVRDIRALWDLNVISDLDFLDDFYNVEYQQNVQLNNYASLTKSATKYQLAALVMKRLNNIYSVQERLPELTFNLNSLQIGDSRFYYNNTTYAANLNYKPKAGKGYDTIVLDTINTLSYSRKFFRCLTISPYITLQNSGFSKGVEENNLVREAFTVGGSLLT
ncbi:LPS-assembly protein LptD, partial [Candidatus Auribacterota bacterium]